MRSMGKSALLALLAAAVVIWFWRDARQASQQPLDGAQVGPIPCRELPSGEPYAMVWSEDEPGALMIEPFPVAAPGEQPDLSIGIAGSSLQSMHAWVFVVMAEECPDVQLACEDAGDPCVD